MTHTQKIKRLLERLGFVHVAGWVAKEDAPKIRRLIEKARPEVEKVKRDEAEQNGTETGTDAQTVNCTVN